MDDLQDYKKTRTMLYEDVWAEPMTTVAKKYGISDNGVRKRCKSLNIPIPPFGYWAKVKAGKPVDERPPLPSYEEIILSHDSQGNDVLTPPSKGKRIGLLELLDLEDIPIDQLEKMHGLDLLVSGSLQSFTDWCDSLVVPERINDYDGLILKHKSEIEYREARDKEYPFRDDRITFWKLPGKIKDRNNESVLPIEVSNSQRNRAYRIADTVLKAFHRLRANISVDNCDRDNININLLSTTISFSLNECKTKRRYLNKSVESHDLRPLYEQVFDGRLQIDWQIKKIGHYYESEKVPYKCLSYVDSDDKPIESQISNMIFEIYRISNDYEIINTIERKKTELRLEKEKNDRLAKELAEKRKKIEGERRARKDSLMNDIAKHADDWFKYQKLTRYANELEVFLSNCSDEEAIQFLNKYIQMVRDNTDQFNPINTILDEMKIIEGQDHNQ